MVVSLSSHRLKVVFMIKTFALPGALALLFSGAAFAQTTTDASKEDGYYGAVRIVGAKHKADDMASTARPRIGSFVSIDDSAKVPLGRSVKRRLLSLSASAREPMTPRCDRK